MHKEQTQSLCILTLDFVLVMWYNISTVKETKTTPAVFKFPLNFEKAEKPEMELIMKKFDFTVNCTDTTSFTLENRRDTTINNIYQNSIFSAKTKKIADEIVEQKLTMEEIDAIYALTRAILKYDYIKQKEIAIEYNILDNVKIGEIVTAGKVRDVLQEWYEDTSDSYSENVVTLVRVKEVLNKLTNENIFKIVFVNSNGCRQIAYKRIG